MNQPWPYALIGGIIIGLIGTAVLALATQDRWLHHRTPVHVVRPLEA